MSKIAIKITSSRSGKYIVPIRKYTGLGISEIKHIIENKILFAETDTNDTNKLGILKDLVNTLKNSGAAVKIFNSDKYGEDIFNYQEIPYEEFLNHMERLKDIMDELQDYDDAVSEGNRENENFVDRTIIES